MPEKYCLRFHQQGTDIMKFIFLVDWKNVDDKIKRGMTLSGLSMHRIRI